jgi:hypothetical protein
MRLERWSPTGEIDSRSKMCIGKLYGGRTA